MAGQKSAQHSLTTEIKMIMDMQENGVVGQIGAITDAIEDLNVPFTNIQEALKQINNNPFEGVIRGLERLNIGGVTLTTGKDIKDALEDKIKSAIVKSRIEFIGKDEATRKITIKLDDEFWDKNMGSVRDAMAEALSSVSVDLAKVNPLDLTDVIKEFNTKFNAQLVDLVKDRGLFDLYKLNKDGKKSYIYGTKFKLDKTAVDNIMKSIQDGFVSFLTDPKHITMDKLPSITIKSDELNKVVKNIEASIGDIDKFISIDSVTLKDLPNINNKLVHFKESMEGIVKDINSLANQLDSLKFGSITENDIEKASQSIEKLKNKVVIHIDKWATSLANELGKSIKSGVDLTELKNALKSVNDYLDYLVVNKLTQLKADIDTVTAKRSTESTTKIQQLPDTIVSKITESIVTQFLEAGAIDLKLDANFLDSTIDKWRNDFYVEMSESLEGFLSSLYSGVDSVIDSADIGVNGVVARYLSKLKNINNSLNELDGGSIGSDLDSTIIEDLKSSYGRVVSEFTSSFRQIFDSYKLSSDTLQALKSKVETEVNNIVRNIQITSTTTNTAPVNLDNLIKDTTTTINSRITDFVSNFNSIGYDVNKLGEVSSKVTNQFEHIRNDIEQSLSALMYNGESLSSTINQIVSLVTNGINEVIKDYTKDFVTRIRGEIQNFELPSSYVLTVEKVFKSLSKEVVGEVNKKLTNLEFDTTQSFNLKLDTAKSKIEKELNKYIKNLTFVLDEQNQQISFDTTKLSANIDKYIQKVINAKASAINKIKLSPTEAIQGIELLQNSIGEYVKKAIDGYAIALKESVNKKFSAKGMGYIFDRVVSVFNRSFYTYAEQISSTFEQMTIGDFGVKTSDLNADVKRRMATKLGVTPRELTRQIPEFKGTEYGREIMRANIEVITDLVNKFISTNLKTLMDYYKESIKDGNIEPDAAVTGYILDEIKKFQDAIISKVKEMVRDQFKFLTEEIKRMNLEAKSLGYRPTQEFTKAVAKANPNLTTDAGMTAGELKEHIKSAISNSKLNIDNVTLSNVAVTTDGVMSVSAEDIRANITKDLITEAPQVVVNGKVVDLNAKDFDFSKFTLPLENYLEKLPFNNEINTLLPQLNKLKADDFLKGSKYSNQYKTLNPNDILFDIAKPYKGKHSMGKIFENMARYFFVGYAMQLPIKALTSANKVSAELDYRIAKAKQNILIKDPTMTNTARSVVYDRYVSEGRSVNSNDFQEEVTREATKLRNIMSTEMSDYLLNISKAYYQEIGKVGQYYEIASRRSRDPYEALTKTREIAKILAAESDMDSEFAGTGLEALSAQWGIKAENLGRYTNMMLKTAMLSNTTVTDLLSTQRDTAAMFKGRLDGKDIERDYATAMALSSMFVESTGKSGRESGTFWRNVLQRPYVKDSRKYIESAGQYTGFENLDPYYTDEQGVRRQKDFLTMFSDIIEATLKVDDPSKMTMLSEIFPVRTIGGAESVMALVEDMKKDLEKSVEQLKQTGQLDANDSLETISVKEVIEKYIDNIMDVTDHDIAGYIAGLQDTAKYNWQGVVTQWESTVYSVFMEFKEEASVAMTYLKNVLKMFEGNSNALSEVIKVFAKIGTGLAGENLIKKGLSKVREQSLTRPTQFQKTLAEDYNVLRITEHTSRNKKEAIELARGSVVSNRENISEQILVLQKQQSELDKFISYQRTLEKPPKTTPRNKKGESLGGMLNPNKEYQDSLQLQKSVANKRFVDDELERLQNAYSELDLTLQGYDSILAVADQEYKNINNLARFLYDNIGARDVGSFEKMFSDLYRNEYAYKNVAQSVIRSKLNFSDKDYSGLINDKTGLEARLNELNSLMFENDEKRRINAEIMQSPKARREDVVAARKENIELVTEYSKMDKEFKDLTKELDSINKEILDMNVKKLETERIIFEAERPKMTELGMQEKSTKEIIDLYRDLMPSVGVDVPQFEVGLDKLAAMFKEGKVDVDLYEDSLRDISVQLGISDRDFDKFKESIRQINAEVKLGTTGIMEYISALKGAKTYGGGVLPNTSSGGNTDVVSASPTGGGLGNIATLAGGAMLGKSLKGGKMTGVLSKLTSFLKGGTAKAGTMAAGAKALLPIAGKLALVYAVTDLVGKTFGGLAERGMTDADRLTNEADKYESLINKQVGYKVDKNDSLLGGLVKSVGGGGITLYDSIANQINRWFGGTAPSFKDTWKISEAVRLNPDMTNSELRNMLKEQFDVEFKRFEGNVMKQEEQLSKNPFKTATGDLRDYTGEQSIQIPLEELMGFIERELSKLNNKLIESDALFTQTKLRMLISGISENSQEMRDAMKEHLERNISQLEGMVEEFKLYLAQLRPGSENYTVMQMQIMDLENKLDENRLSLIQNEFSEFDAILDAFNKENTNTQARYDIKKYDALLKGVKEDSSAVRQIENKLAEAQINAINSLQTQLRGLADRFSDQPDRQEKILAQMLQLDVEKRKLLYEIKEKLPSQLSTFNLPSEIQPITYYEAMTRRNTHKNMSVRAGDTIVNVNIANMSGSDRDIDKIGKAVSDAVNQVQKNFVRQFANDVKTGMGNNYYSWNNY